jgi:hypothetical protein
VFGSLWLRKYRGCTHIIFKILVSHKDPQKQDTQTGFVQPVRARYEVSVSRILVGVTIAQSASSDLP